MAAVLVLRTNCRRNSSELPAFTRQNVKKAQGVSTGLFLTVFSPFKQHGTAESVVCSPGMAAALQRPENGNAAPSWAPARK